MFGYVIANRSSLSDEELARYKGCYCGLCRALRLRHGSASRLTLTYDMTFLVELLSSLYEPEEEQGEEKCFVHPGKVHSWWANEITDYAADISMVLAYLKCRDDWDDDCDPIKLAQSGLLKKAYRAMCEKYPRQCGVINDRMAKLTAMEIARTPDPDGAARLFGELMGEIFVYREDRWSDTLRAMGSALGRFIYLMDAVVDMDKDARRFSYNPLEGLPDAGGDHYRGILDMFIGECVYYFDKLPIVQDTVILRSVLCSGVWTAYMSKFYPPEKGAASDDSGSL